MSIEECVRSCPDPELFDYVIDNWIVEKVKDLISENKNIVCDSRIDHFILKKNNIKITAVLLKADIDVLTSRYKQDRKEGGEYQEIKDLIENRQRSDEKRYAILYEKDIFSEKHFDKIIDTSKISPEDIVRGINS